MWSFYVFLCFKPIKTLFVSSSMSVVILYWTNVRSPDFIHNFLIYYKLHTIMKDYKLQYNSCVFIVSFVYYITDFTLFSYQAVVSNSCNEWSEWTCPQQQREHTRGDSPSLRPSHSPDRWTAGSRALHTPFLPSSSPPYWPFLDFPLRQEHKTWCSRCLPTYLRSRCPAAQSSAFARPDSSCLLTLSLIYLHIYSFVNSPETDTVWPVQSVWPTQTHNYRWTEIYKDKFLPTKSWAKHTAAVLQSHWSW